MTHDFRKLAERVYDIFTRGTVDELPTVFEAEMIEHEQVPGSDLTGVAAVADWVRTSTTAFPDIAYTLESVVGSGDEAVCRVRMTGTHQGAFLGAPGTGAAIDIMLIDWIRISDGGKVAEHWGAFQEGLLMQQVGLMPAPAPAIDLRDSTPARV